MSRAKKVFLLLALIFLLIMAFIAWDFSRRTEFRKFGPQEEQQQAPASVQKEG